MYHAIADVLDAAALRAAVDALAGARFVDGRVTAGWSARLVKNNLQVPSQGDRKIAELRETITAKIMANQVFRLAVRPKAVTPLILSRYEPGMAYGAADPRRTGAAVGVDSVTP